ncbi:MAG: oleate hydratase [Firmicutes bacterium]|nr:oleate hydratase [Bacillota bacterium]
MSTNYEKINTLRKESVEQRKAYLVGGGIGSLAAAAYLIRDGHVPGKNIYILEKMKIFGGSMDGTGTAEEGYIVRGGRELEAHMECMWDLFATIPSLTNPNKTVLDEVHELNMQMPIKSICRIIEEGKKADFSSYGLNLDQITVLTKLVVSPDDLIGNKRIDEWFEASFFETNFWCFWRTMFAFENWHSVLEVKRYMVRFMHLLPGMNQLIGILHTEYNQYDSMILPLQKWLEAQNVNLEPDCQVNDLDIDINGDKISVTRIHYTKAGKRNEIDISKDDLVFVTNGSMTANSTYGTKSSPAVINRSMTDRDCWTLWEKIAKKHAGFGNPAIFANNIDQTKWLSFTATFRGSKFLDMVQKFTDNAPGTGGIVSFKKSNWLLSVVTHKQPHFINQPEDVKVVWGYGLFPDKVGDFVKKPMADCSGMELLSEVCYQFGFEAELDSILKSVINCIPCMMPYITSQFMPRSKGDRPDVVPVGSTNFAFLGQFTEIPGDCVFTVEYSIRSAMMAVYTLLDLDKEIIPVYAGQYDVRVLEKAAKALLGPYVTPIKQMAVGLLKN